MSILISGSLAYDHIMNFPDSFKNHIMPENIHILNVCFMVDKLERSWGGTSGNIAFAIKLLGGEPLIVSTLGKDGDDYLRHFEALGINTKYINRDAKRLTASAYLTTDADDNQIIAFYGGPLELSGEISVNKIEPRPTLAIIGPTQKEVMIKHLNECAEIGIETIFDPGQQITAFTGDELRQLIGRSKFLIGNDYEMKLLEDRTGWSAKDILQNVKVMITTLGERGSVVTTAAGEKTEVKSCPPKSFDDPTGAGDAYRAGFFTGYELGYNWKTCAQLGSVAASYAIETYGTQEYQFTKQEFCERYQQTYGEKVSLER